MTPELKELLIEGFIPPWQDKQVLSLCTCLSPDTVDNWVAQGKLPPPRKRGGKLMWKWSEVDERLSMGAVGGSPDAQAERIREATRAEAADVGY